MDAKDLKFWKYFAFVLLFLNIVLLGYTLIRRPMDECAPGREEGGPAKFIIEQLHFDKAQESKFIELKDLHHSSILKLDKEGLELRQLYFNGLKSSPCVHADSVLNLILQNQREKEVVTFNHFNDVKMLCNSEQQLKFNSIIDEVLERLRPPHDRPRRRP